jgi:exodeoxyribonuclease VII large subunit
MKIFDKSSIFTVTGITHAIKNNLENDFRFVKVRGEISNLATPYSGHTYFTLKDDSAQLKAVLFKQQKRFIDLAPANGQMVFCSGRITVYEPRGEYQLVVDGVQLEGEGMLQLAFEKLKGKLGALGYFDQERKKPLPPFPEKIAVITSPTGAALQDFLKIDRLRGSNVHILIIPVRVQGENAADEIVQALKLANCTDGVDTVVLCRGGGSLEDLWAFNEEKVARAIFDSSIPVVTGIGHETDFTIADFCSDFRCPTPTAAAEKIIPDTAVLSERISTLSRNMKRGFNHNLVALRHRLLLQSRILQNFNDRVSGFRFRLQMSTSEMLSAMTGLLRKKESGLSLLLRELSARSPRGRIALQAHQVGFLRDSLNDKMLHILDRKKAELSSQAKLLNSVSPLATLGRGYSITRKFDADKERYQVITESGQTAVGDRINVLLHRGELECEVSQVKK